MRAPELAAAAACYAAALLCCAGSWRALLPNRLGIVDAIARYGVGSLANTVLPARIGDGLRISLFARVVPGGVLTVVGAVASVGALRWLALTPLGLVATTDTHVPRIGALVALLPLAVAVVAVRRGKLTMRPRAYLTAALWVGGVVGTRVLAAAAVGSAFGAHGPLAAALLVVPALELAGIVPLGVAGFGIAGGAAAVAFHAHGLSPSTALAAGLALHGIESGTSLVVGGIGAVSLARRGTVLPFWPRSGHGAVTTRLRHRFVTTP